MAASLPAIDGQFLYNGELFVDVGNMNRHKRASIDEIKQILRPNLKKTGAPPPKDPVAHWWQAQLIHYGLPSTKDKARAKMRLLDALNASNLAVPQAVRDIESNLTKAFATGNRKTKGAGGLAPTLKPSASQTNPGSKRKNTETSSKPAARAPAIKDSPTTKKAKTNSDHSLPASSDLPSPQPPPRFRTKQTARKQTSRHHGPQPPYALNRIPILDGPAPDSVKSPSSRPRTNQTARKQVSRNHGPQPPYALDRYPRIDEGQSTSYHESEYESPDDGRWESLTASATENTKVKKEAKVKREPNSQTRVSVKKEKSTKSPLIAHSEPATPSGKTPVGLINGVYDIRCPDIESQWPCDKMTLTLALDSPAVWGAYDFSVFLGIIYTPQRPYSTNEAPKQLNWRGREREGEMSFGDRNTGEINFLGNGRIQGWMNLDRDYHFEGVRQSGPGSVVRTAASMRAEWDGYNEDAYEYERVSRWH